MSTTLTIDDREVEDWRIDQLRRAGWSEPQALVLALDPSVDLHLACDLLAKGCPPSLALRILS